VGDVVAKEALRFPWLTPSQVSDGLRDVYGVLVPRQRAEALLSRAKAGGTVARRVSGGRRYYQVMDAGIAVVRSVKSSVLFITPQQSLTAIRAVEDILGTLKGFVRVCDPYVDGCTLDWLSSCQQATKLDLLTTNIKNRTTTFARDLAPSIDSTLLSTLTSESYLQAFCTTATLLMTTSSSFLEQVSIILGRSRRCGCGE
jgi:hypothetical protein